MNDNVKFYIIGFFSILFLGLAYSVFQFVNFGFFGNVVSAFFLSILAVYFVPHVIKVKDKAFFIIFAFTIVFNFLGILPISNRRDYIDEMFWLMVVSFASISMLFGYFLAGVRKPIYSRKHITHELDDKWFKFLLVVSSFVSLFVISKYGFLIVNPENRFQVSSFLTYLIEMSMIVGLCYFARCSLDSKKPVSWFVVLLIVLLLSSSGYRNQVALFIFGLMLTYFYTMSSNSRINLKMVFWVCFILFLFLGLSFYLRVEFSGGDILDWESRVAEQDIFLPNLILPILPIHDSARETLGIAEISLERASLLGSIVDIQAIFFMDLLTILPGFSSTATGLLGDVVGNSDEMFLVPGSLGALLLSFGFTGLSVFYLFIGFLVRKISSAYEVSRDPIYVTYLVVLSVYMIQFSYRGFPKPMYFFALIIIYVMFKKRHVKGLE